MTTDSEGVVMTKGIATCLKPSRLILLSSRAFIVSIVKGEARERRA